MTFRRWNFLLVIVSSLIIVLAVVYSVAVDDYGLFFDSKELSKKPYRSSDERTSKYLLAHRYIPENFVGVVIGPSQSANLDTELISYAATYNASINAANISELKIVTDKLLENQHSRVKYFIISLSPYITKDNGKKTNALSSKDYWGSLGSINQMKFMVAKVLVRIGIYEDYFSAYGYFDFTRGKEYKGPEILSKRIEELKDKLRQGEELEEIYIDEIAYGELGQVVDNLRANGVQVFAYFYPVYHAVYELERDRYKVYEKRILELFGEDDVIWNFNDEDYLELTTNPDMTYDGGHLSYEGADYVVREIDRQLHEFYGAGFE